MKLDDWLAEATTALDEAGIATARLDALVLLEDTVGKDRSHLLAHPEIELTEAQSKKLEARLKRRKAHEPLAYIKGKTEFYGRDFIVNKDVLEPRSETETMLDLFKALELRDGARVVDVGTGSGAIGITAKLERPDCTVDLIDIDEKCLQVAGRNVFKYRADLKLLRLDLLTHAAGPYDVILANLPYVPDGHTINKAAMQEPRIAIFGGEDGLDLYRRLFAQLAEADWRPHHILTEALPFQHADLAAIAKKAGFKLRKSDDFIQLFTPA